MQDFKFREIALENYLDRISLKKEIKNYYKNKTILITGAAGAIGSNLILALSKIIGQKGKIVSIDNLSSIKRKTAWNIPNLKNILFVEGDIKSEVDLYRCFREKPDIIFHLAAFFANQNSVDYPLLSIQNDIEGHVKLLQYAQISKVEKIVYASSGCAIYGSYPSLPVKEDFISMKMTTPYQINKMTGEMYNNFFAHHYGMHIVNCRFFNSYGPGEVPGKYRNVIPNFIYWAIKNNSIPITGKGDETRDFTSVYDLIQGLILAGYYKSALGENFNLGSNREVQIISIIKNLEKFLHRKIKISFVKKRRWDTKKRMLASINKAKQLIKYKPVVKFETGLKDNLIWIQDNIKDLENLSDFGPGIISAHQEK